MNKNMIRNKNEKLHSEILKQVMIQIKFNQKFILYTKSIPTL